MTIVHERKKEKKRKEKKRKEKSKKKRKEWLNRQAFYRRSGSVNESSRLCSRLASGRRGGKSGGHGVPCGGRYAEPRARFKRLSGLGPGSPRCRPCCRSSWFLDHGGILDQRTGRVRSRKPTTGTTILPSRAERNTANCTSLSLSLSLSLSIYLFISLFWISIYSLFLYLSLTHLSTRWTDTTGFIVTIFNGRLVVCSGFVCFSLLIARFLHWHLNSWFWDFPWVKHPFGRRILLPLFFCSYHCTNSRL